MAIYAMSDIHGMYTPLKKRIYQLKSFEKVCSGNDTVIFLGDYIDVGMNSFKVVSAIYELQKELGEKCIVLMGNHDRQFLDFMFSGTDWWLNLSSFHTISGFMTPEEADTLYYRLIEYPSVKSGKNNVYDYARKSILNRHKDLLMWYKKLPLYYETDRQIFVHAGVDEEAVDLWKYGTEEYTFLEKYPASTGHFYKDIIAGHISSRTLSGDNTFHDIWSDCNSHFYIDGIDSYPQQVPDADRYIPLLHIENLDHVTIYSSINIEGNKKVICEKCMA